MKQQPNTFHSLWYEPADPQGRVVAAPTAAVARDLERRLGFRRVPEVAIGYRPQPQRSVLGLIFALAMVVAGVLGLCQLWASIGRQ